MKKQTKQQRINELLKTSYQVREQIADLRRFLRKIDRTIEALVVKEKKRG
ncbi:MAG: hypothetical protein KA100_06865 [Rickettsiales bacterium]|nr:hypothetical protein [Rickettsiales bacterium]